MARTPYPAREKKRTLPDWFKLPLPRDATPVEVKGLVERLGLHTVCASAKCPNLNECWSQRTATFMVLGNNCTRRCFFCSVPKATPDPLDPDEPRKVAEAARTLGLQHVVVTSVDRDDLPDKGAAHFVSVIEENRANLDPAQVRELADGRVYTATQALDAGLIDGIAYLDEVIDTVKDDLALRRPEVVIIKRSSAGSTTSMYAMDTPVAADRSASQSTQINLLHVDSGTHWCILGSEIRMSRLLASVRRQVLWPPSGGHSCALFRRALISLARPVAGW